MKSNASRCVPILYIYMCIKNMISHMIQYHTDHDMIYDDTLGVCARVSVLRRFRRLPEKGRPEEGRDKVAESSRLALACYENMMNIKAEFLRVCIA